MPEMLWEATEENLMEYGLNVTRDNSWFSLHVVVNKQLRRAQSTKRYIF